MTMAGQAYPWRVPCRFQRRSGFVALDQLRTVDRERLIRRLGRLTPEAVTEVLQRLQEMGVVTTTTPVGAYRGARRPYGTAVIERAMDALARELKMDPVEVRRRNLVTADRHPYATGLTTAGRGPSSTTIGCGDARRDRGDRASRAGDASLTIRCGPNTFADMKDAVLTIRVAAATRRQLEALARQEGRSLSAQAERLIEQGLSRGGAVPSRRRGVRPLAGALRGGIVPTLADFREVRKALSTALLRGAGGRTQPRR